MTVKRHKLIAAIAAALGVAMLLPSVGFYIALAAIGEFPTKELYQPAFAFGYFLPLICCGGTSITLFLAAVMLWFIPQPETE